MTKKPAFKRRRQAPGNVAVNVEGRLRRIRNELSLMLAAADDALEQIDHSKKQGEKENA